MSLLMCDQLTMAFGGLQVLRGLSFAVEPGQIVALIGPNGAGKTTALNLISGLGRPTSGAIRLEGRSIAGLAPAAISQLGVARNFQSLRLFLNMSVLENMTAVGYRRARTNTLQAVLWTPAFRRDAALWRARAEELLGLFGSRLGPHRYDQPAYSLSYANRRRLEIARALMTRPKLLLLDEPAAGMNPHETDELAALIAALPRRFGLAILLIEHDMGLVERVADQVIVLDHGAAIAVGSFAEVTADHQVIAAYLGQSARAAPDEPPEEEAP
ncbi:MAG: ABC transporter ATP-binding protein [Chloroflexi bacterium OHK40]